MSKNFVMDFIRVLLLCAFIELPAESASLNNQYYPLNFNENQKPQDTDSSKIFDTELLRYSANKYSGNFMVSPTSVKAALAILLEGARGSCADELKRYLRLPDDQNEIRQYFKAFMQSLNTRSEGILLESSNKIFLSDKFTPESKYNEILRRNYNSELKSANFHNPVSTNQINSIINASTHGLIPNVFNNGDISPDTILILINVLYFKGFWEIAFSPLLTKAKCFTVDGGCRTVAMMETKGDFRYGYIERLKSQAVEIPFKGGKYSMVVLLPNDKNGLSLLINDLPYFSLPNILEQMDEREVELYMPRFNIDFAQDLVYILQQIGIQEVFNSNADLFGIISNGIKSPQLSSVFHKTHIEVNEEGATAAAITAAMVVPLMGSLSERVVLDHPFLFFIRDVTTGNILFQGRVTHPTQVSTPPVPIKRSTQAYPSTPSPQQQRPRPSNQQTQSPSSISQKPKISRPVSQPSVIDIPYQSQNVDMQQHIQRNYDDNQSVYGNNQQQQTSYSNNQQQQPAYINNQQQQPTRNINQQQQPSYSDNQQQQPAYSINQQQQPTYINSQQQQPARNINQQQQPSYSDNQQQQPAYSINQQQQPTYNNNQQQQPARNINQQQQPSYSDNQQQQPAYSINQQQQPTYINSQQQQPARNINQQQQPSYSDNQQQQPAYSINQQQQPTYNNNQQQQPARNINQQQQPSYINNQQQYYDGKNAQSLVPSSLSSNSIKIQQDTSHYSLKSNSVSKIIHESQTNRSLSKQSVSNLQAQYEASVRTNKPISTKDIKPSQTTFIDKDAIIFNS